MQIDLDLKALGLCKFTTRGPTTGPKALAASASITLQTCWSGAAVPISRLYRRMSTAPSSYDGASASARQCHIPVIDDYSSVSGLYTVYSLGTL